MAFVLFAVGAENFDVGVDFGVQETYEDQRELMTWQVSEVVRTSSSWPSADLDSHVQASKALCDAFELSSAVSDSCVERPRWLLVFDVKEGRGRRVCLKYMEHGGHVMTDN